MTPDLRRKNSEFDILLQKFNILNFKSNFRECVVLNNMCSNIFPERKCTIYDVEDMVELIASYKDRIEGITFLGGEPLEQIEAVTYICKKVKELGLTVLVFTGYNYKEIATKPSVEELIRHVDILIDGEYREDQKDFSRAWVGSSNQTYYFFSDRYDESVITEFKNKIELRIDKNNNISLNGMGNFEEVLKAI